MSNKKWGCHLFRRHQCRELGFDWTGGYYGYDSKETLIEDVERSIDSRRKSALIPRPRPDYKLHVFQFDPEHKDEQVEAEEVVGLRKLNKPFMEGRRAAIAEGCGSIFRNLPEEVQP